MFRIIGAIVAFMLIIAGVMMISNQGIFAQNITFDKAGNSRDWTGKDRSTASFSADFKPVTVNVISSYEAVNTNSH